MKRNCCVSVAILFLSFACGPVEIGLCLEVPEIKLEEIESRTDAAEIKTLVESVAGAVANGNFNVLRSLISRQYLEAGDRIKAMLEKNGQSTKNFDQKILGDFDFYSLKGVEKVAVFKDVAFIEFDIEYKADFVEKRRKTAERKKQSESLWNDWGGRIFSTVWETGGGGRATYYLARQNNMWKLHCAYFSTEGLGEENLKKVHSLMENIAGPNNF